MPRRFRVEDLPAADNGGKVQQSFNKSSTADRDDLLRPLTVTPSHHCPTGCPSRSLLSSIEAMTSRHGGEPTMGSGLGSSSTGLGHGDQDGPWNQSRFLYPPAMKAQDQWNFIQHGDRQFWVKIHHTNRVRPFHPTHRSQPFDVDQFQNTRVTVKFYAGGQPLRVFDLWTGRGEEHEKRSKGEDRWLGYTFFEMKKKVDEPKPATHNKINLDDGAGRDGHHENRGGQAVNVYVSGPTVELGEAGRPYHEIRMNRERVYDKGSGKGEGHPEVQEMLRRGFIQGGAAQRGRALASVSRPRRVAFCLLFPPMCCAVLLLILQLSCPLAIATGRSKIDEAIPIGACGGGKKSNTFSVSCKERCWLWDILCRHGYKQRWPSKWLD